MPARLPLYLRNEIKVRGKILEIDFGTVVIEQGWVEVEPDQTNQQDVCRLPDPLEKTYRLILNTSTP